MSLLSFLTNGASSLINNVGGVVDQLSTSDEEKETLKNSLFGLIKDFARDIEAAFSERHATDMSSDSWLSKNVRPLLLLSSFYAILIFATLDAFQLSFQIRQSYLDIFEMVIVSGIGFYFAGRTSEKIAELIGKFRK